MSNLVNGSNCVLANQPPSSALTSRLVSIIVRPSRLVMPSIPLGYCAKNSETKMLLMSLNLRSVTRSTGPTSGRLKKNSWLSFDGTLNITVLSTSYGTLSKLPGNPLLATVCASGSNFPAEVPLLMTPSISLLLMLGVAGNTPLMPGVC